MLLPQRWVGQSPRHGSPSPAGLQSGTPTAHRDQLHPGATGADRYEENAEGMFKAFDRIVEFFLAQKSGELYVGECSVPSELPEEVEKKAIELARSLVT